MVRLIVGKKGTGKTKILLENVKRASEENRGNIIFINASDERICDLDLSVRVINAKEYKIKSFNEFSSFIKGATSQNYDITHIFIDGLFKIVGDDISGLADFVSELNEIAEKTDIDFFVTISADKENLPAEIYSYIM